MRRLLAACLALASLAGCGAGAGEQAAGTSLLVTDRFGADVVKELPSPEVGGGDTVMRLLQRNAEVRTRFGGGFVQAIDGRAGGKPGGRPVDWFFYVNGVEAEQGAASVRVRDGDQVWWDRHDWGAAMRTAAVVGSFPAPFTTGLGGERLPVRVECDDARSPACDGVVARLVGLGLPAAKGRLARSLSPQTLRVVVAPWRAARGDRALRTLEQGPQVSGVFARPSPDGRRIDLLDARGRVRGRGQALVAAVRVADEQPVWVLTGTDEAGVRAAADAFAEDALRRRFALAIADGERQGLPLP